MYEIKHRNQIFSHHAPPTADRQGLAITDCNRKKKRDSPPNRSADKFATLRMTTLQRAQRRDRTSEYQRISGQNIRKKKGKQLLCLTLMLGIRKNLIF